MSLAACAGLDASPNVGRYRLTFPCDVAKCSCNLKFDETISVSTCAIASRAADRPIRTENCPPVRRTKAEPAAVILRGMNEGCAECVDRQRRNCDSVVCRGFHAKRSLRFLLLAFSNIVRHFRTHGLAPILILTPCFRYSLGFLYKINLICFTFN